MGLAKVGLKTGAFVAGKGLQASGFVADQLIKGGVGTLKAAFKGTAKGIEHLAAHPEGGKEARITTLAKGVGTAAYYISGLGALVEIAKATGSVLA